MLKAYDALPRALGESLLGYKSLNLPVPLVRPPNAAVLWVHPDAVALDPNAPFGVTSLAEYESHLLNQVAYLAATPETERTPALTGYADRYGGAGLSNNGGAARAAYYNGYYVKGIGKTGLLGLANNAWLNCGGAYLAEGVREVILSLLFEHRIPGGTVPVLALIDTGQWIQRPSGVPERSILIVRPTFLRPAHLLRPYNHTDAMGLTMDPSAAASQVAHLAQFLAETKGLPRVFSNLATRWGRNHAAAVVHRLNHVMHTESNITLNGTYVDFGGSTAAPSWNATNAARAWRHFSALTRVVHNFATDIAAVHPQFAVGISPPSHYLELAKQAHARGLIEELLRLLGLDAHSIAKLPLNIVGPLAMAVARKELCTPKPVPGLNPVPVEDEAQGWVTLDLWGTPQTPHWEALKSALVTLSGHEGVDKWRENSKVLTAPLTKFDRGVLTNAIHAHFRAASITRSEVTQFITRYST